MKNKSQKIWLQLNNRLESSFLCCKKRLIKVFKKAKSNSANYVEDELAIIQRSTRTTFRCFIPLHNALRMKWEWYYNWHLKPYANKLHISGATLASVTAAILIIAVMFSTLVPQTKASNYSKTWSTTDDFNTGTNSNIDTSGDEAKLASTTTDFNEGFTSTTNKDAASDANWDTALHKLNLPGDPNSGVATDLQAKWKETFGYTSMNYVSAIDIANNCIYMGFDGNVLLAYNISTGLVTNLSSKLLSAYAFGDMVYDSTNHFIYFSQGMSLSGGSYGFIYALPATNNPSSATLINLAAKAPAGWSTTAITRMAFDTTNNFVYLFSYNGNFGVFNGGADPANGTTTDLTSIISADWSTITISSAAFDTSSGYVYFAGNAKFGAFLGGADPINGTWVCLNSKWNAGPRSMVFDSINNKIYMSGFGSNNFAVFSGGADPANGTATNLSNKISGIGSGSFALGFDSGTGYIYLGQSNTKFGVFSGGSDPSHGTATNLSSKLPSAWGSSISSANYYSANGKTYLVGTGIFCSFLGGSNPANGTLENLTSTVSTYFKSYAINSTVIDTSNGFLYVGGASGNIMAYKLSDGTVTKLSTLITINATINSMVFDSANAIVYMAADAGKFAAFSGGSDPANGTFVNLSPKINSDWSTNIIYGLAFDSANNLIYLGGSAGKFGTFLGGSDPANGTWTHLSSKISSDWSTSAVYALAFDSANGKMYIGGASGRFGVFTGGSDSANGTWVYLNSKINSSFGSRNVRSICFDSTNNYIYLGGGSDYNSGDFGAFLGGSDPASGTWVHLNSKISSDWGSRTIYSVVFASGKVFLGGQFGKFGVFSGGSNPSAGTWNYLYSNISSINSTNTINTMTYIPDTATVYLGADNGKFTSFFQGYATNKSGISTAVDSTTQKIYKATLTATESKPANTDIVYYLSNDGGAHWYEVSSGSEYTFTISASDLRWKAYLVTSNAAVTPEITGIAISYKYFNSDTGTMSLVYDAEQTVVPVWLSWIATTPTNTALTFKIRTASTQAGLTSASWSDSKNASDTPVNLKTLNVGGTAGVPENRWSEVYASFSTTDGLNTPVLSELTEQYVINAVPEIESVSASQRTDGSKIIDVSYSIKDSDAHLNPYNQGQVAVSLQYSVDSGSNWSNCTTTTGTGLKNVNEESFTSYTASWDIATDLANSYYDNTTLIKLIVNDNEQAHNLATLTTSPFSIDSKDPVTPVFTISGGANASGKVNLTGIGATDDTTLTQMIVTLDSSYPESAWQAYSGTLNDFPAESGDTIYVKVKDSFGNVSAGVSHKVPLTVQNVVLSDLSNATAGDYRLAIGWSALNSESDVNGYWIYRSIDDGAYSLLSSINDRSVNGAVDSSVSPSHSYEYQIFAADTGNNIGMASNTVSGQPAFVPTVSSVDIGTILADKATITWTTDVPCDSFVEFGANTSYGAIQGSSELTTSHNFTITGLNSETTFHFRVRSRDQKGTLAVSADGTFTTAVDTSGKNDDLSKKPSKISNVEATDTNFTSTVIIWQTSVVSLSELQYGTTTDYGKSIADSSANYTTQHTVKVTALEQGTAYHFRIKGTDLFGNQFVSDDYAFNTLSMPEASEIEVKDISSMKATISWKTNIATDSNVDYGLTDAGSSQGNADEVLSHSITLINLSPASTYQFKVRSRDKYGNVATSAILNFKTVVDATAPEIKDMKSEVSIITDQSGTSKAQAIISWSTDEPATSQIRYAQGVAAGNEYPLSTTEDANLTTSHVVIISNLQPSSTYHMMLVSTDSSGNIAASDDYTVLTLNQEKSLLQYIVQILEERFSWLKGFGLF